MDERKAKLTNLVLAVCHLCDRTRDLATADTADPLATVPVNEALGMVEAMLMSIRDTLEADAVPGPLPSRSGIENVVVDGWLLDDGDVIEALAVERPLR